MQQRESVSYKRRRYFGFLLAAGVTAIVVRLIILPALHAENFGITFYPDGRIEIRDFPSILVFAKGFWKGHANYDVESYIRVTSEWAGRQLDIALPFPYSPTMLWLLAPFCALPTAWAFTLWTLLGLGVVWWLTGPRWPIWVGLAFFSPTAMVCFSLGQTVVLTTAAMLFLISLEAKSAPRSAHELRSSKTMEGERPLAHATSGMGEGWGEGYKALGASSFRRSAARDWSVLLGGAVLWALGAKPPVAVTAGVALVCGRHWRVLLAGLAMTLFTTLLLTPLLGADGLLGYLGMLANYDTQKIEFYARNLFPEKMGNLRALLHVTLGLGDTLSFRCSAALWACAIVSLLWAARAGKLDAVQRWGLAVLAYLLFCPHVVATEELHLVLILALVGDWRAQARPLAALAAVALALTVLFLPGLVQANAPRIALLFTAKVGLALVLIGRSPTLRPLRLQRATAGG